MMSTLTANVYRRVNLQSSVTSSTAQTRRHHVTCSTLFYLLTYNPDSICIEREP